MKKLLLTLVVLAVAAPLYAQGEITFSFVNNWDGTGTITYDANEVIGIRPVAMGLTIDVTSGAPITAVICEDENDFLEIFMDSAYDMELDPCTPGYAYGDGNPIAKWDVAGEAQLADPVDPCDPCGLPGATNDGMKFAISMGGLGGETDPDEKEPPMSGSITLASDGDTEFEIYENLVRGGIIGEDGEAMVVLGLNDGPAKANGPLIMEECYKELDAYVAGMPPTGRGTTWANSGKPICWCFPKQCHGDAHGRVAGSDFGGWMAVEDVDLNILSLGWLVKDPKAGKDWPGIRDVVHAGTGRELACADFKHDKQGSAFGGWQRVEDSDLNELSLYWLVKEPKVGKDWPGVPKCTWTGGTIEIHPCTLQPGTYVTADEKSGGLCYGM